MFQLFKGTFYYCDGPDVSKIHNKTDCINEGPPYRWVNRKYNFDNLGQVSCLSYMDGFVQDFCISSLLALDIMQSSTGISVLCHLLGEPV